MATAQKAAKSKKHGGKLPQCLWHGRCKKRVPMGAFGRNASLEKTEFKGNGQAGNAGIGMRLELRADLDGGLVWRF